MGLHAQMLATTMSYLEAARSALQWVSAPDKNNLDQAVQKLKDSRKMKSNLEENQWLISR